MQGKALLLIGLVAGAIYATTPQGRKVVNNAKHKFQDLWASPDVQRTVSNVGDQVRNVPVVGDTLADGIQKTQPSTGGMN